MNGGFLMDDFENEWIGFFLGKEGRNEWMVSLINGFMCCEEWIVLGSILIIEWIYELIGFLMDGWVNEWMVVLINGWMGCFS